MEGSFPFTVVLKAPDGTVADVLVDCSSDWNVSQLKLHICDVYPTRPDPQNQKLIHAGHLLQDGQVLRDAIRQVCTKRLNHDPILLTMCKGGILNIYLGTRRAYNTTY